MTIPRLILVAALGQAPADPAELASRLGSPRYAEREQAGRDLLAAGEAAIPALREAARSRDPERKNRASALLRQVEAVVASTPETMVRPSLVRLDLAGATLDEALDSFDGALEGRVGWLPDVPAAVRGRRVTIRNARPVPFWTAIDQIAEAGDLRTHPGSTVGTAQLPPFRLHLTPGSSDAPRSDSGPLRLVVDELKHGRTIQLAPAADGTPPGTALADFRVGFRLVAEPRLLVGRVGPASVQEAVDDLGRSLVARSDPGATERYEAASPARGTCPLTVRLERPRGGGRAIRRLRLSVPVEVLARRPEPAIIPLDGADGRSYRVGPTTIRPIGVDTRSIGPARVRLAFKTDPAEQDRRLPAPASRMPVGSAPPDLSATILDVVDPHGHLIPWAGASTPSPEPGGGWLAELTAWGGGNVVTPSRGRAPLPPEEYATAVPASIHYYGYARAVILATFEFRDLPLP